MERVQCRYCGEPFDKRGYKNHVRQKSGNHGDRGTFPESFDGEGVPIPNVADDDQDDLDVDVGDDVGDQGDDSAELDLGDDDDDGRIYDCGNCGHDLDYLGGLDRDGGGKECPNCGERLYWSMVEA